MAQPGRTTANLAPAVKKIFSYEEAAALLPEVQRLTQQAVEDVDALPETAKNQQQRVVEPEPSLDMRGENEHRHRQDEGHPETPPEVRNHVRVVARERARTLSRMAGRRVAGVVLMLGGLIERSGPSRLTVGVIVRMIVMVLHARLLSPRSFTSLRKRWSAGSPFGHANRHPLGVAGPRMAIATTGPQAFTTASPTRP